MCVDFLELHKKYITYIYISTFQTYNMEWMCNVYNMSQSLKMNDVCMSSIYPLVSERDGILDFE